MKAIHRLTRFSGLILWSGVGLCLLAIVVVPQFILTRTIVYQRVNLCGSELEVWLRDERGELTLLCLKDKGTTSMSLGAAVGAAVANPKIQISQGTCELTASTDLVLVTIDRDGGCHPIKVAYSGAKVTVH